MDNNIIAPIYAQIALDIALRISKGDLKEKSKVFGRSVMASEYGVSPETIRRAMRLLEDMEIVESKHSSGSIITSAENAKKYIERFGNRNNIRVCQKNLNELLEQQELLCRQIAEVAGSIVRINEKFSQSTPFNTYEVKISENSKLVNKTIGDSMFWQNTSATIIAIRRSEIIILSPGPYAVFYVDDTIIFVGDMNCIEAVIDFVNQ
ncbi:MAG: GntR family transcriptional regulator [Firmicutes bacterium HGW-Firmicutes-16]|nr:MAG: GntR family transcriptional regulator [Firmicutes bacterium HGW-Firmicutes-16]